MRRPRLTNSITIKITEADYLAIKMAAGADSVSDWLRDRLPDIVSGGRPTQLELLRGEVLALRRILLNLELWRIRGTHITEETLLALIAESNAKKLDLARAKTEG